jgi:Leucine-rich repeat (LRR) protein
MLKYAFIAALYLKFAIAQIPCAGSSEKLSAKECQGFQNLYDGTGGVSWIACNNRNDPCGCSAITCVDNSITQMFLSNNKLNGTIPAAIGSFSNLTSLEFESNYLSGAIPPSISNLKKLKFLWLAVNSLTGTIPASMGELKNLKILDIDHNNFSGSIPAAIAGMSSLEIFDAFDNNISGTIPSSLSALSNLLCLDLFNNDLTGSIPASIGEMGRLKTLALAQNRLTGLIPELPFARYTGGCGIDLPKSCISPKCNHFTCPLPSNAAQCKASGSIGVHCNNNPPTTWQL